MSDDFKFVPPKRAHPLRSATTAYRRSDRGAVPKRSRGGPLISSEDVVLEAVKLGYKIADEQILKGQDFARKLRGASLRSEAGDMGNLVDQGLRLARQFAVLLVEMTETTVQAPAIAKAFAKAVNEGDENTQQADSARPSRPSRSKTKAVAQTVPIQVKSQRATCVQLVLYEALSTCPEVYPLYLKGDEKAALHNVTFEPIAGSAGYRLRVVVPDTNPPGCYRGYAINPADGEALGSIEVTLEAE